MNTLFINATRNKTRFPSKAGQLSIEHLWDLPRSSTKGASLDDVYKRLRATLKAFEEESLLSTSTNAAKTDVENQIAIVRFVFDTKQAESAAKAQETIKAQKRAKLLDALANKQDEALGAMSEEDIRAALAEL